ncbi:hypothetical protein [Cellulophaga baltica]|uniref:Uncharacterized protein n=1 Tax=Cellulophaga baltica TaxID=76594 RepID=A0A1G7JMN7_9FLAO|nr:hypothetical protein [Cellulophaga baltica]SDF26136.1 hypothetical protein SAMN04487992_1102 [Cellulophaga baltica]
MVKKTTIMHFNHIISEFNKTITSIKLDERDVVKRAYKIIVLCKKVLLQMNKEVSKQQLTEEQEINFFKNIKIIPFQQL